MLDKLGDLEEWLIELGFTDLVVTYKCDKTNQFEVNLSMDYYSFIVYTPDYNMVDIIFQKFGLVLCAICYWLQSNDFGIEFEATL